MKIVSRGKKKVVHLRFEYDSFVSALCSIDTDLETIVSANIIKINCLKCLSIYLQMPMEELEELDIEKIQTSLREGQEAAKPKNVLI